MGGGGGNSGPTVQQQQLQTQQALDNANLNVQENDQRKVILNAMTGTRDFRGSALSRSLGGNNDEAPEAMPGAPSQSQINSYGQITVTPSKSLLDQAETGVAPPASATPARGTAIGRGGLR